MGLKVGDEFHLELTQPKASTCCLKGPIGPEHKIFSSLDERQECTVFRVRDKTHLFRYLANQTGKGVFILEYGTIQRSERCTINISISSRKINDQHIPEPFQRNICVIPLTEPYTHLDVYWTKRLKGPDIVPYQSIYGVPSR